MTAWTAAWPGTAGSDPAPAPAGAPLAREILADDELREGLDQARALLRTGLSAGSGYGEVWIRELNTFIELALQVNEPEGIRDGLLTFSKFQGEDGNIVDGYIPAERAKVARVTSRKTGAPCS